MTASEQTELLIGLNPLEALYLQHLRELLGGESWTRPVNGLTCLRGLVSFDAGGEGDASQSPFQPGLEGDNWGFDEGGRDGRGGHGARGDWQGHGIRSIGGVAG